MNLILTEMDEKNARAVLGWRYDEPYSFYNPKTADLEKDLQTLTGLDNFYYAMTDETGGLVAYFCFGREAQVAGGDYAADALDIGCGVHPELTGRGFGSNIINAGINFALNKFAPSAFRATVAAFNRRALNLCKRAGFSPVKTFERAEDGREFIILWRKA